MKRILAGLLAALLCSTLVAGSAFADNRKTYRLPELGLELDLWDDYVVFTRDMDPNDPNFEKYGLTKAEMCEMMEAQGIYLDAWDEDVSREITVTMKETLLQDYYLLSDTALSWVVSGMKDEYAKAGIDFLKWELYQNDQAKFIKLYFVQRGSGSTLYGLQYHTVYEGKSICINLKSFYGEIGTWHESVMRNIADSVRFDRAPQVVEKPDRTDSFVYTDEEGDLSFTVPENWVESELGDDARRLDAGFTSVLEEGLTIFYTEEDIWAELPEEEKSGLSRKDVDNSLLSKADVAEILGCREKDISMVITAGREYFYADFDAAVEWMGLNVSVPMIVMVRCEDGILYMFQFSDDSNSAYYDDFISLVESVQYPSDRGKGTADGNRVGAILVGACMVVFCGILMFGIVFFVVSKLRGKKAEAKKPVPKKEEQNQKIAFCHMCGNKLPEGSKFCNECGTQIPDHI